MLSVQFCPEDGVCHTKFFMHSSVSIVTRLWAEQPRNRDSVAGTSKTFVWRFGFWYRQDICLEIGLLVQARHLAGDSVFGTGKTFV